MLNQTRNPLGADMYVTEIAGIFPVLSQNANVSTNATLGAILAVSSHTINSSAGAVLLQPAGAMYVNFGAPATTANFLMVANAQYKIEGDYDVLKTINLYATGSTKVNIIIYAMRVAETIWGTSSSSSGSSDTSSSSDSSKSLSSHSTQSVSSASSNSLSTQSSSSSSGDSGSSASSKSSASNSSASSASLSSQSLSSKSSQSLSSNGNSNSSSSSSGNSNSSSSKSSASSNH